MRWPSRWGEFDAVVERGGRTVIAMEAKARVEGSDGLARLLRSFLRFAEGPPPDPTDNHSRKYVDLMRRCEPGPVTLWLVAAGARWTMRAERRDDRIVLSEGAVGTAANRQSPDVDAAVSVAEATEVDGEQRAYPIEWRSAEELDSFYEELRPLVERRGFAHTRPWRWHAESSGGEALTAAGEACGRELRFSWYE
jgi:hypothetical protein